MHCVDFIFNIFTLKITMEARSAGERAAATALLKKALAIGAERVAGNHQPASDGIEAKGRCTK